MTDVYIKMGAGFAPQSMSALDPGTQASIVRYVVALRFMLTGGIVDRQVPRLSIGACFGITQELRYLFVTNTAADAVDRIAIVFDPDRPGGPPIGFGMIHKDGDSTHFFDKCVPWLPQAQGRASLVAGNVVGTSRYMFGPDGAPMRSPAPSQSSTARGHERAMARLTRLARSGKVRSAVLDIPAGTDAMSSREDYAATPGAKEGAGADLSGADRLPNLGNTYFSCKGPEYQLSFIARDRDPDDAILMQFRAFTEEKFLAVSVWLGERQHLWPEWRGIAEALDGEELGRHLASLHTLPAFEEFMGPEMIAQREEEPEITIAAWLTTRRLDILRHRFASLALRDAFLDWVNDGDPVRTTQALALQGLLEGREILARHIDDVAEAQRRQLDCSNGPESPGAH